VSPPLTFIPLSPADVFIISDVILALTALPGYQTDTPMPSIALWRAVATAFGVAVEVLTVSVVLPVTARWVCW